MYWECGCGVVNKDSRTKCSGCMYPKGAEAKVWVSPHIDVWEQLSREIGAEIVIQDPSLRMGLWGKEYKLVAKIKEWTFTLYHYSPGALGSTPIIVTAMIVPYVNKDGFEFTICRKTVVSGWGKLFGMQDVEVGHPELDRDYIIKSNSVPKVRALLANPIIRGLIRAQPSILFKSEASLLCYEREGQSRTGSIEDAQRLKSLFDLFAETLNQLVAIGSTSEEAPNVEL